MLINLTNHNSKNWGKEQTEKSLKNYGNIIDLPFPDISPNASGEEIESIAFEYFVAVKNLINNSLDKRNAVHLMGEFTFVFKLLELLKKEGIESIASTSQRNSIEKEGKIISEFKFVRFRNYF